MQIEFTKLKKITEIFNNYREMKKDLQLCINFGCKKLLMYHYRTTGKRKYG